MGNITYLAKWDSINHTWHKPETEEYGKSIAFATFNYAEIPEQDYFIIIHGSRVENFSKDNIQIKDNTIGIDKIGNFFAQNKQNMQIKLLLLDNDAPLIEEARVLANYIDALAMIPSTRTINVLAHSKGGALAFYVPSYFKNPLSFAKTNIFTSATPFKGTLLAAPPILYPQIKEIIASYVKNENLANHLYNFIIKKYESISSNSHMDYDIGIPLSDVPSSNVYDANFIPNILSHQNLAAMGKLNAYHNFIIGFGDLSFGDILKYNSLNALYLYTLDRLIFDGLSDGMVLTSTQRIENFANHSLDHSHHDIFSQTEAMSTILHLVNDTIDEQHDKELFTLKRKNN